MTKEEREIVDCIMAQVNAVEIVPIYTLASSEIPNLQPPDKSFNPEDYKGAWSQ